MEFNLLSEIAAYCQREGKDMAQAMVEYESRNKGVSKEQIYDDLKRILLVMEDSVDQGLTQEVITPSGMLNNWAKKVYECKTETLGSSLKKATARAIAVGEVNACMGKIAAAPTAGSAGIMPAVLVTMMEEHNIPRQKILDALLVSSAVGLIFAKNSSFAGSEAGCMGETGSAAAMGAAAITYLLGGSEDRILEAVGFALKASMGLVCDPVGGLVEEPCTVSTNGPGRNLKPHSRGRSHIRYQRSRRSHVAETEGIGTGRPGQHKKGERDSEACIQSGSH